MASKTNTNVTAEDVVKELNLSKYPVLEGGFYTDTYSSGKDSDGQVRSTAIYFLLTRGNDMGWLRLHGRDEMYHFYAGDPAEMRTATPEGIRQEPRILGSDILRGQRPQVLYPAGYWQSAKCLGEWTLFGCTVTPGFEYEKFEVAPRGWQPTEKVE